MSHRILYSVVSLIRRTGIIQSLRRFNSVLMYTAMLAVCTVSHAAGRQASATASGRTLQLVTDAACQAGLSDLLDQWEADRRGEGWKVLKRIVTGADAAALQARLRSIKPDHTFMLGDGVPFLTVVADPDGHGARTLNADYRFVKDDSLEPYGAIGRVWFKNQVEGAKVTSKELYRRYLKKRHTWDEDRVRFGPMIVFDDHLSYRPDGVMWGKAVMSQAPSGRIEHLDLGAVESDGEITRRAKSPRLFEIVFSGGLPFQRAGGLFYFGDAAAWRDADPANWGVGPRIGILGAYGSSLCEMENHDNLLLAALTTQHTIASFYDFEGTFPFGKMLTGSTIGDCGRLSARSEFYLTSVYGDPTITIIRAARPAP